MKTNIFYDDVSYRLRRTRELKSLFNDIIIANKKTSGDLSFVFVSDEKILSINEEFLKHDYYTDIITFDYCENNVVNGEIYISIDSVRNNAKLFGTTLSGEVRRVMIHGVLHLCGYDDHAESDIKQMRFNEDFWLGRYRKITGK